VCYIIIVPYHSLMMCTACCRASLDGGSFLDCVCFFLKSHHASHLHYMYLFWEDTVNRQTVQVLLVPFQMCLCLLVLPVDPLMHGSLKTFQHDTLPFPEKLPAALKVGKASALLLPNAA